MLDIPAAGTITKCSEEKGNKPTTGTHYYVVRYSIWEEQKRKANQSRQLNPCTLTGVYHLRMLSIRLLPASLVDTSNDDHCSAGEEAGGKCSNDCITRPGPTPSKAKRGVMATVVAVPLQWLCLAFSIHCFMRQTSKARACCTDLGSKGFRLRRSRWWAPSGITTATRELVMFWVTPPADHGSRPPLL